MFKWFKVLKSLLTEDDFIERQDRQIKQLQEDICALEKRKLECEEMLAQYSNLLKVSQEETADLKKQFDEISSAVEKGAKIAKLQLLSIKNEAENYAASMSEQINHCEDTFADFNRKLSALKDAVTSFQR